MFIYTKLPNGNVSLEMMPHEWSELLFILGMALAATSKPGQVNRTVVDFVNRLNRTNPEFTQYELPDKETDDLKRDA